MTQEKEQLLKKPEPRKSKYPPIWQSEIEALETFFSTALLPDRIQLTPYETIYRPVEFVAAHLQTVKNNNGNPYFQPYLDRLRKVKELV